MEKQQSRKLAVILHADIVGSTALVRRDETLAHARIHDAFRRFSEAIDAYGGTVHEVRGDALVAEFSRASDAVSAALQFQQADSEHNARLGDEIVPWARVGIALGEEVFADATVTGSGVVLAQRLEQLAEAGGVVIQGAAAETVPQRMPFDYKSLGERQLKGFDQPIRAFAVSLRSSESPPPPEARHRSSRTSSKGAWAFGAVAILVAIAGTLMWWKPWAPSTQPASVERMAFPLPDKPSIAVLPFDNLSDDPRQEYFADGMTEDLITDLAKLESLLVIARNTVFTYKDRSVVVPEVARDLGVKYILEGSVRRAGDVVRINTQLIDGASGTHIWAERYDASLADIFSLQDQVTSAIVAQLEITLTPDEQARRSAKYTDNPDAHDAYLRGWQFYRRSTPQDFVQAIPHLKQAVELDPDYGQAWAALASIYWITYRKGEAWSRIVNPDPSNQISVWGARDKAQTLLRNAMRHPTPLAHQVESEISWDYRQYDLAIAEARRAVALNPNDPAGHLAMAWALIFDGQGEAAVAATETALRLDPDFPGEPLFAQGTALLLLGRAEEARATLLRALGFTPENFRILVPLAVAYARNGQLEEARATIREHQENIIFAQPRVEEYMRWWPFKQEADVRLFGDGLIQAAVCCAPQFEDYVVNLRKGGTLE